MITVIKRDAHGQETLRYSGEVIERGDTWVRLRAIFQMKTRDLGYMVLKQGDIFTETFYSERWYNIFAIEDVEDGTHKGWYCNLTRPAEIHENWVAADDLALDVFVKPDGSTQTLDEDEYEALNLRAAERAAVRTALQHLHTLINERAEVFQAITSDPGG